MLKINEIFYSIQGESTFAGLPTVFVRLTYCNLRCSYCDTEYAFYDGKDYEIDDLILEIEKYNCNLIEITGGEPLMQEEVHDLMSRLVNNKYQVMLETGGSLPINKVNEKVRIIMDLKTPSSLMMKKNLYENLNYLKPIDEIKFVIGNREDYEWSKNIINEYKLKDKIILFSTVFGKLENQELVNWILEDNLNVRFQLQMHKYVWHPQKRGV